MAMSFTVAADISSFTESVLSELASSIATKLNVNEDDVTVSASAGSVQLDVAVIYPTEQAALDAKVAAETGPLADTAAASQFLAVPSASVAIQVTAIETITVATLNEEGVIGTDSTTVIAAAGGGGVAVFILIVVFIQCRGKRGATPTATTTTSASASASTSLARV